MNVTAFLLNLGLNLIKNLITDLINRFGKKMPACGYARPQEVFMRQFYLGKTSSGYSQKFGLERTAL